MSDERGVSDAGMTSALSWGGKGDTHRYSERLLWLSGPYKP